MFEPDDGAMRRAGGDRDGSFDGEEFLYHLYRGSELLQDNCVGEAKEELERALSLQPRDVEGQGLLGVVYFRLGMYPRAIAIYEGILRAQPREITPRVNLALCYFKTGQLAAARDSLELVIASEPDHRRAWGYLGLVLERQGEVHKALSAFERAGHEAMAERLRAQLHRLHGPPPGSAPPPPSPRDGSGAPSADAPAAPEGTAAASGPLAGTSSSRVAEVAPHLPEAAQLDSSPPPRSQRPSAAPPAEAAASPAPAPAPPRAVTEVPPALAPRPSEPPRPVEAVRPAWRPPSLPPPPGDEPIVSRRPAQLARDRALPTAPGAALRLASGAVVLDAPEGCAARAAALVATVGPRGPGAVARAVPGFEVAAGATRAVLAPAAGRELTPVALIEESLYVVEPAVVAFGLELALQAGSLSEPLGVPVAQLSGTGTVVVEHGPGLLAVPVGPGEWLTTTVSSLVGWRGRLVPRRAEGRPGSLTLAGDGTAFVVAVRGS